MLYRDPRRRVSVVVFLYAAGLIEKDDTAVVLAGADLQDAVLGAPAWLVPTSMGSTWLAAILDGADLREANLARAYLMYANLDWAQLTDANLRDTHMVEAQLVVARSLEGANLPDGLALRTAR